MQLFTGFGLAAASILVLPVTCADVRAREPQQAQLPWRYTEGESPAGSGASLLQEEGWRASIGDKTYYAPPAGAELSRHVGDYFYALGARSALTQELEQSRVGGDDRWHIFNLPGGPSLLQQSIPTSGDRRESMSSLVQLTNGVQVSSGGFPEYKVTGGYKNPLTAAGQAKEKEAAEHVTKEVFLSFLENLTSLPGPAGGLPTRSYSNPSASKAAQEFLKHEFGKMGLTACTHGFVGMGQQMANVVAVMPGKGSDSVVVGAHYDSRPFDGKAPGAEDNGSGVAALLAVARAFMLAGVKPEKNVYFVGFAAEEPGLKGSAAFAREMAAGGGQLPSECRTASGSFLERGRFRSKKAQHRAIVLDEVGWVSPAFSKATVNLESYDWDKETGLPELMDHMAHASHEYNGQELYVVHSSHPFGSDHMSFLQSGIPAVLAINGDDERYPHYHKSSDTIENVTPDYAAQIAKMVLAATVRSAGVSAS